MERKDLDCIRSIIEQAKGMAASPKKEYFQKKSFDSDSVEVLKQLSFYRENLYRSFPFQKDDEVLILGAECGYLTDFFCEKVKKVTCVETDEAQREVCQLRNAGRENVSFCLGRTLEKVLNELEHHTFDVIICDGGLEKFGGALFSFLKEIKNPSTKVYLSGENRLGMKYWNGSQNSNYKKMFAGLETDYGKEEHRLYSRKEYLRLIEESKLFTSVDEYYPYPDTVFPVEIFSDERLPRVGELNKTLRDFSERKISLFRETEAFDVIVEEEEFPTFSVGLLFVLQ